jgi:hypothetical protein
MKREWRATAVPIEKQEREKVYRQPIQKPQRANNEEGMESHCSANRESGERESLQAADTEATKSQQ